MAAFCFTRFKLNKLLVYSASTAIACVTTFQIVYEQKRHQVFAEFLFPTQHTERFFTVKKVENEVSTNKTENLCNANYNQSQNMILKNVQNWSPLLHIRLMQNYSFDKDVAVHLANNYGEKAFHVAKLATISGKRWSVVGRRLHPECLYLEAELRFALRKNVICSAVDLFSKQAPLSQLNVNEKLRTLPRIVTIMAEELGWNQDRQTKELKKAKEYLNR